MSWPHILVGTATLLFGRRLFWVFVAATGFAVGALLAVEVFKNQSDALTLGIALGAGIVGALIALFAQKVAIGLAGFLGGGYLGLTAGVALGSSWPPWVFFVLGGVLGSLLLSFLFDWALIALSSLVGAVLVVAGVGPGLAPPWPLVLCAALVLVGLAVQSRRLQKPSPPPKPAPAE